jgi:hypothetical protein
MAADSPIKLAAIEPYLRRDQAVALVAAHYGVSLAVAGLQAQRADRELLRAGF